MIDEDPDGPLPGCPPGDRVMYCVFCGATGKPSEMQYGPGCPNGGRR